MKLTSGRAVAQAARQWFFGTKTLFERIRISQHPLFRRLVARLQRYYPVILREVTMSSTAPFVVAGLATLFGIPSLAQTTVYPKPAELPNPYVLVKNWPTLPKEMNGGHWGEVIRVHVAADGNVWVFHRCFNTVPPGHATCIGRGGANPPILEFSPSGKLVKSFGAG